MSLTCTCLGMTAAARQAVIHVLEKIDEVWESSVQALQELKNKQSEAAASVAAAIQQKQVCDDVSYLGSTLLSRQKGKLRPLVSATSSFSTYSVVHTCQ
jgi:hypothetical protein